MILTEMEPDHGLLIKEIEGLGPPKANISKIDLTTMDGSLFNSARLESRNILIHLLLNFAPTIEDARQRTYKYFPVKKKVEFKIETDNHTLLTNGVVESNEPEIFSEASSTSISLMCEDPFFYSDQNQVTVFFGVEPMFEFEFENDSVDRPLLEFGEINDSMERRIYYYGDSEVGIKIYIHAVGEVGDVAIYNVETRENMKISAAKIAELTGSGIINGDDIIISTVRGDKTIKLLRNGKYINILNAIDKNSDWFQLSKGENVFTYVAESGYDNLEFRIENQIVYEGV